MDGDAKNQDQPTRRPTKGAGGALRLATFQPGEVLSGRFKIIRFIARGGMGEVYEAEDLELLERVALKTIRSEIAQDERTIRRFLREINLARRVTHHNVCRIFDVSYHQAADGPETPRRVAFVSMELLSGETLAEWLSRAGRLSADEAQPIVAQMAAALAAAHHAGVIHRDFKSSNVMLLPSPHADGAFRAVVTDFGLARRSQHDVSATMTLTSAGEVYGTPTYMAPEQVQGAEVTPATDVYALGVVMYEMVTGTPPFVRDTPVSTAVKRLQAPALSPRTYAPDLSPHWEATILKCLERDPRRRFQDASDVGRALAGEAGTPTVAWLRRRWSVVVGVAVVALLAATSGFLGYRALRTPQAPASDVVSAGPARRAVAVLGFRNLSGQPEAAWLSNAFSEMLTTELAAGEGLRTIPGENVTRAKNDLGLTEGESFGDDTLGRIRAGLGTDLVVLGSYLAVAGGKIRLDLRLQDAVAGETVATFTDTASEAELLELMSRTGARLRERLGVAALSADQTAGVRAALPSTPEAARLYADGVVKLRLFDALSARDLLQKAVAADRRNALAHAALAAAWSALGYDVRASSEAKAAFDLSATLSREHRLWIEARRAETSGEWDKGIQAYTTLWTLFPDDLDYGLQLASAQLAGGHAQDSLVTVASLRTRTPASTDPRIDLAEAEAAGALSDFKRQQTAAARSASRAVSQGARLLVARARLMEGDALENLGNLQQATGAYEEAQRIYLEVGDRGGSARSLGRLAVLRRQQGDLARARGMYERALDTFREIGDERSTVALTGNLANVLRQQGDLEGAKTRYQEALAASRRIGDRRSEAQTLHSSAIIFRQQGDLTSAKALYRQALAIRRELGIRNGVASTLNNLANALYDEDDLAGAKIMYEESLTISREIGDKNGISLALGNIAGVLADQGNLVPATTMYEEALGIRRELGNKSLIANSLSNLANLLEDQGDLPRAETAAQEGLGIYRELGETRGVANVQFRLGEVRSAQGNLGDARRQHEEALALREKLQEKGTVGESRVALAKLSMYEGNPKASEALARQAVSTFRAQRAADDEALALVVVATSLLAQNRAADARTEISRASTVVQRSQNRLAGFAVAIASARVDAATRRGGDARASLTSIASEAAKLALKGYEFEARLALGEVEMRSGEVAAGRARLVALEKDASSYGFGLIAQRAAAAIR